VNSGSATLVNNIVAGNQADVEGSGLRFRGVSWDSSACYLQHNTIADNHGSGEGVFVGAYATLALTNTILAGHTAAAITVTAGSTVTLEATLWHNSGPDTGGEGEIVSDVSVHADPLFVQPALWDYHLAEGSPAIDAGVEADVATDIDGEARPQGIGYDIGADEFFSGRLFLPLVLRSYGP
jgi:hypothetical protein